MTQPPRRVDVPTPGYYLCRLVRNGPRVGAQIIRHDDGTWSVMRDGERQGPTADPWSLPLMHKVAFIRETSTEDEVKFRIGHRRWAEIYAPESNEANPRRPVDIDKLTPF